MKNKQTHASMKAEGYIQHLISILLSLFTKSNPIKKSIDDLYIILAKWKEANPEFSDLDNNCIESNKMNWRLVIVALAIIVDFFLLFNTIAVLCDSLNLPTFLTFIVPAVFVLIELAISYFSAQAIYDHTVTHSKISKYLPYAIIIILIGLSALAIFYLFENYAGEGTVSFTTFIVTTCLVQLALLAGSILLHIWLIKHAEQTMEAIALWIYRRKVNKINRDIKRKEEELHQLSANFVTHSRVLVHHIDMFKMDYPHLRIDFERSIPEPLLQAINRALGKRVFKPCSEDIPVITPQ